MKRLIIWGLLVSILLAATSALSGPILKPRKYYGPIPQSSFTLRVGFLGGVNNDQMFEELDRQVAKSGGTSFSEEISNSLIIDGTYVYKLHPQFAVRASFSAAFIRQNSNGLIVANVEVPDSILLPVLDYDRNFEVDLFTIEGSALYFFSDAAVKDFQPYAGGGFSLGIPHARFTEVRLDREKEFKDFSNTVSSSKWSTAAGVHAILGAAYYITNKLAFSLEGRLQMMQSTYPIGAIDPDTLEPLEVDVEVKYSGFMLNVGVSRAF